MDDAISAAGLHGWRVLLNPGVDSMLLTVIVCCRNMESNSFFVICMLDPKCLMTGVMVAFRVGLVFADPASHPGPRGLIPWFCSWVFAQERYGQIDCLTSSCRTSFRHAWCYFLHARMCGVHNSAYGCAPAAGAQNVA